MIITQLLGGLGNQMFQYALGRRLSLDRQVPLLLDCHLLHDSAPGRHAVQRQYGLDVFHVDAPMAPLSKTLRYSAWGLPKPLRFLSRRLKITSEARQTREVHFGFDERIVESKAANVYLSGMWQSMRYFEPIETQLRADFRFARPLDGEAADLADQIAEVTAVCLHVRRTDYVAKNQPTGPLAFVGLDYYRATVERVCSAHPIAHFFVFSDDIPWCREHLNFVPRCTFVKPEIAGYKDSAHLQLMTGCQVFVVPNSTFSWWAAWLSTRDNKDVYLPAPWFRDPTMDASGLYCEGWRIVPTAYTSDMARAS